MLERRRLAALLVRAQAMLWTAEDPASKAHIQRYIQHIERQLLALQDHEVLAPAVPGGSMARLGK